MDKARVLYFDIETMANLAYVWGKYEQNIIAYKRHWYMLSFAWKWLDSPITHFRGLPDYATYKKDKFDDKALVKDLWSLFEKADVVVAHNGRAFDVKKAMARFAVHNFPPPKPFKQVDTKEVAKRHFKFDSNSLNDLADYFKIGRKINTGGFDLWQDCEQGIPSAWKKMKEYNIHDVILGEKVYLRMLPYMNNHPNIALLNGLLTACPSCGSTHLHKRGFRYTRVSPMIQYQCQDCKSWSYAPTEEKQVR